MAASSPAPTRPPEAGAKGLHVLVVDDDPDCARSLALLLEQFGHGATVAPDGPAALAEARARPPDVVLLDIALPGMDGYELSRRLHEGEGQKPPFVIALSGYPDDAGRRAEAGIDLHLLKPADPAELAALLERLRRVVHPGPAGA
jgi:two-component system OmpR family response regulator